MLLEEAAFKGIPAIIIDPKGDLTNLLLHFPDLAPQDFQPRNDSDLARRAGKTLNRSRRKQPPPGVRGWRNGEFHRNESGSKERRPICDIYPWLRCRNPSQCVVFAGRAGNSWKENREVLREKITSTVTALLGLVGYTDIDPLRSREHILLANIFEKAWSQGKDVELAELILQTQTPPFEKLGAFPVETFFPAKDRMELAMVLNNILAAPAFETWREGSHLNIGVHALHCR